MDTDREFVGDATYDPGDNKLRLYPYARLDDATYERVKAVGFSWAPKQHLFVAPMWTPSREDLLIELCGEIGDEDTSLVERAEERAERFEELSVKRVREADSVHAAVSELADGIPLGQPILVGHHSERRARKDAERIQNGMRKAVNLWKLSNYWKDRAAGALRHAKYKELPGVRYRRIKTIEADKRKREKEKDDAAKFLGYWTNPDKELTKARATAIANHPDGGGSVILPDGSKHWSAWSALNEDLLTPEAVRDQLVPRYHATIAWCDRWVEHLDNRLAYERAMLEEQGGLKADAYDFAVGGQILAEGKWLTITRINRSGGAVNSLSTNNPRWPRVVAVEQVRDYRPPSVEQAEAVNAATKLPPLCNYPGDGFVRITQEEWDRKHKDYKGTRKIDTIGEMEDSLKAGVQVVTASQLLPTPNELADRMAALLAPGRIHKTLEPSAGTGNLVAAVMRRNNCAGVTAIEISPGVCEQLRSRFGRGNYNCTIKGADFLACNGDLGTFDRIIMNPPFENAVDIKHILHAYSMLKPGGKLVALCANGPRQRERLQPLASYWEDLPEGTFASQGTNVNVALMVIEKPEED